MDLSSLFTSDLDKAKAQAEQSVGNALFDFLGKSLQKEATEAGLEIKNQFTPKIDQNPKLENSVAEAASFGLSSSMLLMGAALVGAFFIFGKKKAA